tara:strand:+ start:11650 stop:12054 length:405 start_codon:yes stop_codon:yes gene_type:complete
MTAYFNHETDTKTLTLLVERGDFLDEFIFKPDGRPAIILRVVQEHYGITTERLQSKSKVQPLAFQRQVAMALINAHTDLTLLRIAAIFDRKDHGTVIHAREKVKRALEFGSEFHDISDLNEKVKSALKANLTTQ